MRGKAPIYLALLGANMIYACVSIFTKLASQQAPFSLTYLIYVAAAVCILGTYAVIWQQIIKRIPITEAYMFKSTTIIFVLLISTFLFGEKITVANIIGATMIVSGIILFAR